MDRAEYLAMVRRERAELELDRKWDTRLDQEWERFSDPCYANVGHELACGVAAVAGMEAGSRETIAFILAVQSRVEAMIQAVVDDPALLEQWQRGASAKAGLSPRGCWRGRYAQGDGTCQEVGESPELWCGSCSGLAGRSWVARVRLVPFRSL